MTLQEVVVFLMLKGYTFDESIRVIEVMAHITVNVSKALAGLVKNMQRLQEADEGATL